VARKPPKKKFTTAKQAPGALAIGPARAGKVTIAKPAPSERKPRLSCRFYKTDKGNEPVKDWLAQLPPRVRKEIGSDIQVVQWRWPLGKPLVDGFGDGLFEVRTNHDGNIYRVLFCLVGSTIVLLHGFMKKTQATPDQDVDAARRRQREEKEP
jgi:phage-related protein